MENAPCEYLLYSINMILICTVRPGTTLKWNIPLKSMKIKSLNTTFTENFKECHEKLLEKKEN
jgi:pentose-5-phosphate-3-epimerase